MLYDKLLNIGKLTETADNAFDLKAFVFEEGLPGIFLIACHIIVGMVACNDHQGEQDYLLIAAFLDESDNIFNAGGSFNGADEIIVMTGSGHLFLNLGIGGVGFMLCTMSHVNDGSTFGIVISGGVYKYLYECVIVRVGGKKVLADLDAVKLIVILVDLFDNIIILIAAHNMSGLNDNFLNAVSNKAIKSLGYVVNGEVVTLLELVNDYLAGESTTDFVIGISGPESFLDGADGLLAGIVIAGSK